MHAHADSIPNIPLASELDACPICTQVKLHHATCGQDSLQ
jgi:hypothetical protein